MLALTRLNISNFRNYEAARVNLLSEGEPVKFVVITGKNGAGKTNILEAVSLMSPGRGLRNAGLLEMKNRNLPESHVWTVSVEALSSTGDFVKIGTGLDRDMQKRILRINGEDMKNQAILSEYVSVIWLTPQMDGLFIEGASERRRFLDRMVSAFEPEHSARISCYERAMRERNRLLQGEGRLDAIWLATLEKQMAENSVAIAASRVHLIGRLTEHIEELKKVSSLFPKPILQIDNWIENAIVSSPAVDVEFEFKEKLKYNREADRDNKKTSDGAHRSDLKVFYAEKEMPADQCSTGEQKALLISIILGHALMMQSEKGFVPIILLDEVAAHLDDERRDELFSVLRSFNGQVWLTGTSEKIFESLKGSAGFFNTDNGAIKESKSI